MMKERIYSAQADTGRDFVEFQFTSSHRAGSKANFEDAKMEYRRMHGHGVKIIRTYLDEFNGFHG